MAVALDDYALVLLNLLDNYDAPGKTHSIRQLQAEDIFGLLRQMQMSAHRLLEDWLPQELAVFEHSYPSVDVVFLFDRWDTLQVKGCVLMVQLGM